MAHHNPTPALAPYWSTAAQAQPSPKVLWVARATDEYLPTGGRRLLGFVGWHHDHAAAKAEAEARYPERVGRMAVERQ